MCTIVATQTHHAALKREYFRIYRFFRRRVRRIRDAEDMTQEVCARYLIVDPVLISSPQSYLMAIARHVLADFYRNSSREPQFVCFDSEVDSLPDRVGCQEPEQIETAAMDVAKLLACLPKRHSVILSCCALEGHSYADAAKKLGLAESTVEKYIAQAREQLRCSRFVLELRPEDGRSRSRSRFLA